MILSEEWKQTSEAFSTFLSSLDNIRHSVQQKQTEFDEHCATLNKKIEETHKQSTEHKIVKLNVGGQKFQTSQETLLSVHESFFWCMLHSGDWKPDDEEHGEYFIDRSPTVFPLILESLRQQKPVSTEHLSNFEEDMLNNDLDFYGLSQFSTNVVATGGRSPAVPVQWCRHTSPGGGIQLIHNRQTAVFQALEFARGTEVITTQLNTLLSNNNTALQITCTDPTAAQFFLGIIDATGKTAGSLQFSARHPLTITLNATNIVLSYGKLTANRVVLSRENITDPVGAVQFAGGSLTCTTVFLLTTL